MIDNLSFGFLTVPRRPETTRGEAALRLSLTFCAVTVLAIFFSYVANARLAHVDITDLREWLGSDR